jgi:hypothetical protein
MLDADTATERNKPKQKKTATPKTDSARRKGERDKEERGTPELTARTKNRTGNSSNPTANREATTPEPAAAAKTATGETEKMGRFRIATNVMYTTILSD